MKRWPTKPLGEVLEISRERIEPSEHPNTLFNYVGLESVEGNTGRLLQYQPTRGAEIKSTKNVFNSGDILYGKLRPYLNKVHLAIEDGICSTDIYVLRPQLRNIHPSFAANFLRSPAVLGVVSNAMAGANLPRIGQDTLLNIPVPIPPLAEQERIVKLLDETDELRKLRAQADTRTDALIPALFHEMFGDPNTNPKGFRKERLEKLIRVKSGDSLPSREMETAGEHAVYGGNGINGHHTRFMFKQPVIVIGRVGAYCGSVHISEPHSWVTDNALYISECKEVFDQQYLAAALRMANLNQYAGRAAQPLVSGNRIYPVSILIPPLRLQNEFSQRVKDIRELQACQAASRDHLDALFQSMLHRAFKGDL